MKLKSIMVVALILMTAIPAISHEYIPLVANADVTVTGDKISISGDSVARTCKINTETTFEMLSKNGGDLYGAVMSGMGDGLIWTAANIEGDASKINLELESEGNYKHQASVETEIEGSVKKGSITGSSEVIFSANEEDHEGILQASQGLFGSETAVLNVDGEANAIVNDDEGTVTASVGAGSSFVNTFAGASFYLHHFHL